MTLDDLSRTSVQNVLAGEFFSERAFCFPLATMTSNGFALSDPFIKSLENNAFHDAVRELLEFGIYRYKRGIR